MKSVLIGSVGSSKEVLLSMIDTGFPVSCVFSLDEAYSKNVSGYQPLHEIAKEHGIPYKKFRKINDEENLEVIKTIQPDYIFVIGLSQLVKKEIIDCARKGVIGFHPTPLPKMRGRAANVWQVLLGVRETKCSLFFIDEGVDSGDIIDQEKYVIDDTDYAEDVVQKINEAVGRLSKRVLQQMMNDCISVTKQNEEEATYLLRRTPEDGEIDWKDSIDKIHRLIRAVSHPFPGAFGHYDKEHKIIIWRAEKLENHKYIGIPGQIANVCKEYIDVVCVDGILRITEYDNVDNVKLLAGHRMG